MSIIDKIGNASLNIKKDPFKKSCVKEIYTYLTEDAFRPGTYYAWGGVRFKNHNTSGEQKFTGDTFDEVVLKIKAFLETLD